MNFPIGSKVRKVAHPSSTYTVKHVSNAVCVVIEGPAFVAGSDGEPVISPDGAMALYSAHPDSLELVPASPFLAIATDEGMSGWGKATGRASFVVYECRDEHERKLAFEYLESRPEMKHVRTNYEKRAGDYSPRNAHVSRYDAGRVLSVRFYRDALEAEKARRAGIDAGILNGTVCRYCGCRVASKSANDAQRNPVETRAQHASDCEWIGTVLPAVAS